MTRYTCSGGGYVESSSTQEQDCGKPVVTCPDGQSCSGGACANICSSGETWCGGTWINTYDDDFNCGSCGNKCAIEHECIAGSCEYG